MHPLRRIYRKHLARYGWARKLKSVMLVAWGGYLNIRHVATWRVQSSVFLRMFGSRTRSRVYSMCSFVDYSDAITAVSYSLTPPHTVELGMPSVFPADKRDRLRSESWLFGAPEVRAIEIPDAEIIGRCEFVFSGSICLHHDLYDFDRDFPAEEMHGLLSINAEKKLLARYGKRCSGVPTENGVISLIGSASANYVHWLTECAPKLALVDEIPELALLPLVVDAGLHPNMLEALQYLNVHQRRIITIRPGEGIRVRRAICVTPTAYVPFDFRRGISAQQLRIAPNWAIYVPRALHVLRGHFLSRFTEFPSPRRRHLYLRRTSQFRQIRNAEEVEECVSALGFEIVEPERLSFAEQVRLFSAADMVVAQAGGALGNIVFAPERCRIIILSAWSPFSIYYYFSNLASILGLRSTYVLCDQVTEQGSHPAHHGLDVDLCTLKEAILQ